MRRAALWMGLVALAVALGIGAQWADCLWTWFLLSRHPIRELEPMAKDDPPEPEGLAVLPSAAEGRFIPPEGAERGWPTLLGPNHDGTSSERGLELEWGESGPRQKWRIPVGAGYAGPVALGDAVVLLHRQEDLEVAECFDAETGRGRWRSAWPARYQCPFAHSSGPYAAPVIEPPHVLALGAAGRLTCLRLEDGAELWHRELYDEYDVKIEVWPASGSPLVDGDRIIVNVGGRRRGAGVVALDQWTGRTLWTATEDGASCATPRAATIHGRRYVFVWTADALVAIDPANGAVIWRIPFAANHYEAAHGTTPLVAGDIVFVSGYQVGNLCARVLPDGSYQELWRDKRELLDSQYNNLMHLDGAVFGFSTSRRAMRCLDLRTGELRWQWRSPRFRCGTTIAVDGAYLVWSESGHLAVLRIGPSGVTVRAMTEQRLLNPPTMSYPALNNGLLYLRNEEEMVCLDLRRRKERAPVEHSRVKHSAVKHSAVKHSAVKHSAVKQSAVEQSAVEHAAVEHAAVERARVEPPAKPSAGSGR